MCYFITLACPAELAVNARAALSGFHPAETANTDIAAMLPPRWTAFYLSDGGCGCRLYRDPAIKEGDDVRFERRIADLRKRRNWSAAKIERAIQQMRDDRTGERFSGIRRDLREAIAAVAAAAGEARVLVHAYRGGLDDEAVPAVPGPALQAGTFIEEESLIRPDMMYAIVSHAR